jgi:phage shock protein PspC (stress-responsive transcriptional regulator)
MKETIKINLNGQLFDLDNDAYERLKNYLESLKSKFGASPDEAKEILEDIESRIAEILQEKLFEAKQVITLADINEIISLLGTAEDIEEPESEEESNARSTKAQYKSSKRFYRDPQNRVFGGVCSGLSAYFNVDPIWIRLLFVFLFFANLAGLIIYVVLWIVIPPAHSTGQRLEMQGKKVTINDIEDSVKKEYEKVKTELGKKIAEQLCHKDDDLLSWKVILTNFPRHAPAV